MKRIILVIINLMFVCNSMLQAANGFSLGELEGMLTKDWDKVSDLVERRHWEFVSSTSKDGVQSLQWQNTIKTSIPEGLNYKLEGDSVTIELTVLQNAYLNISDAIESKGYKKVGAQILNNGTVVDYACGGTKLRVRRQKVNDNVCYVLILKDDVEARLKQLTEPKAEQDIKAAEIAAKFSNKSGNRNRYSLDGRTLVGSLVKPVYSALEEGKIVVNITVDMDGNVVDATIGRGTNIDNSSLRNAAIAAAKKTRFNAVQKGPARQVGSITYVFMLE